MQVVPTLAPSLDLEDVPQLLQGVGDRAFAGEAGLTHQALVRRPAGAIGTGVACQHQQDELLRWTLRLEGARGAHESPRVGLSHGARPVVAPESQRRLLVRLG